ncbi:MAG: spermidine/putrescine ABC transporter substrate-binding protein [Nitrosomonas sp.]|nr:spermidine/putrescine ABC transporter substrate-binding protein [Nitrosomonas sp.]
MNRQYILCVFTWLLLCLPAACSLQPEVDGNQVSRDDPVLRLFNWNNYIDPRTLRRFEQQCRCQVTQDYYADNEELLAKLAAGATGYDLLVPTGNAMDALIRQGALRLLDKTLLPNLKNIDTNYLDTAFDPGNQYSAPYATTVTLLGFNREKLIELGLPVDSWALIFEPAHLRKIKGRVTVLDSQRELMAAALSYLGHSVNDTDPEHWQQAKALIIRAKPYWAAFNNTSYIRELAVGNLWVAHGYSNDMFQAAQDAQKTRRSFTVDFVIPKEGATLSLDSMVLHHSGHHPDLAHQFINFMLEGENSAELTNLTGSGNPNQAAKSHIRADIIGNPVIFPDATKLAQLEMLTELDYKHRRLLSQIWTEIKLR